MAGTEHDAWSAELPALPLLPFLDLVFAVIGILIVIFALRETSQAASGRPLAIDELLICVADGGLTHYPGPTLPPVQYGERQFPALLERLGTGEGGVRNLVLAFTADCFETRQTFEETLARWTARRPGADPASHAAGTGPRAFRLDYRPLSAAPEAVARLLEGWRQSAVPPAGSGLEPGSAPSPKPQPGSEPAPDGSAPPAARIRADANP